MSINQRTISNTMATLVWIVSLTWLAWQVPRAATLSLLLCFSAAFGAYLWLVRYATDARHLLWIAIMARIAMVPAFPLLSDDVWRFIWDGRLTLAGINPLAYTPEQLLSLGLAPASLDASVLKMLNSPTHFTIYPPVCQWIFAGSCWLAGSSNYLAAVYMKAALCCFEIGSILLLPKLLTALGQSTKNALWYILNPLIIIEICGNAHFEGIMVFGVFASLYLLIASQKYGWSAIAMHLAVSAKLLPLMFAPFWIRRFGIIKTTLFWGIVGGALLLTWWPDLSVAAAHLGNSFGLYFQRFEFNAGIYYLFREIGYGIVGYNLNRTLGPALAMASAGYILWLAWRERDLSLTRLPQLMLWSISAYLWCTAIMHPWYTALPLALAALTPYRFAVVWTAGSVLSYTAYATSPIHENLWLTALEYTAVWSFAYYEYRHNRT